MHLCNAYRSKNDNRRCLLNSYLYNPLVVLLSLLAVSIVQEEKVVVTAASVDASKESITSLLAPPDFMVHTVLQPPNDNIDTTPTTTTIAFGSCHKVKYYDPTIWQTIQRVSKPDAFLWLGDTIYPPYRGLASLEQVQNEYDAMLRNTSVGYSEFVQYMQQKSSSKNVPTLNGGAIFGTWDDHDYGGNDMGDEMTNKQERAELFWKFLGHSQPTTTTSNSNKNRIVPTSQSREGIYYSVEFRASSRSDTVVNTATTSESADDDNNSNDDDTIVVKTLFLDTRWNRGKHCLPCLTGKIPLGAGFSCATRWIGAGLLPNYCTDRTNNVSLLGTKQWDWFTKELQQVQYRNNRNDNNGIDLLIIVSSIQVLTTNPTVESWGHFPSERQRLLQLITDYTSGDNNAATSTLLLSGDVHYAEILDPLAFSKQQNNNDEKSKEKSDGDAVERLTFDPTNKDHNYNPHSFLEVTSSALTHDCTHGIYGGLCDPLMNTFYKHRISKKSYYIGRNYGMVSIHRDNSYTVSIHAVENGTVVLTTGSMPLLRRQRQREEQRRRQQQQPQESTISDEALRHENDHVQDGTKADAGTSNIVHTSTIDDHYDYHLWTRQDLDSIYPCMDGHLIPLFYTCIILLPISILSFYYIVRR